ncbi:lactonase family protein [Candidatus Nitrospira salsa]
MNNVLLNVKKLMSATVLIATFGFSGLAQAIVYTASNEVNGNDVIAFDINSRGNLSEIGRFPTGGTGTGTPLGNQAALTTDASDRWMFVVSPGSGELTSFRLQTAGLQFVNKVTSGGFRPLSVTVFGTLVYVLNEGSGNEQDPRHMRYDNISGFRFTAGGILVPIHNSTRIIDRTQLTAPAQVGFNKSGTVLLITEKATDTLTTFVMRRNGTPKRRPEKRPSFIPTPFGFSFSDRDFVNITEANNGGPGMTVSYRIDRETGEVSGRVGSIEQGTATCWTVLSSDQTIGYATNTGDGTISLYRINFDGTLEYFFPANQDTPISTGTGVRDVVLTQNNQFLVTLNNGDGQIRGFFVNRTGAISPRGTLPVPGSVTGLVAR